MGYTKLEIFEKNGYVVLDQHDQAADPTEWLDIEYNDWKSSGVTRFAPLASAFGEIECDGFWNHTPPRTDKDGVWIDSQTAKAPRADGSRAGAGRQRRPLPRSSSCSRTSTRTASTTCTATTTTG